MAENPDPRAFDVLVQLKDQFAILGISGVGGAFFRILLAPESNWGRRAVQGIVGGLSAIFLGGLVAHIINTFADAGVFSYLAAGFLMGTGGELAVKRMQDRVLGGSK